MHDEIVETIHIVWRCKHNNRFMEQYSMCSLAVSTQDSPAVEPRSNPGLGKILMSENLRLYTTSPVVMC